MNIITVDPKECTRWKYADRSTFEFGDIATLANDIKLNGQIEPVFLRPLPNHDKFKYEVIAGSRRWKACLEADLPLKAILHTISDEQAAIIQIKENQGLSICDYSKGIYYTKLLKDNKITQEKLARSLNLSKSKFKAFLYFAKIPEIIWDAVGNVTKVTARTSYTIYSLSQKGEPYISILIDLADEIRKGAGTRKLESIVLAKINNDTKSLEEIPVILPSGITIGSWKNNILKFNKELSIDKDKFLKYLAKFF